MVCILAQNLKYICVQEIKTHTVKYLLYMLFMIENYFIQTLVPRSQLNTFHT